MPSSATALRACLLALGLAASAAASGAGTGRARRLRHGSGDRRELEGPSKNPLRCVLASKLREGDSLDKGEGVCSGNTELASHEFGLTPGGEMVLWRHDYRTGVETVVWKDPSGIAGHHLTFAADGTAVLYNDNNVALCALGEPAPGVQTPMLVVGPQGGVSVRSATTGSASLWTLDPATSLCQRRTRSLGLKDVNPLDCVLRGKLDVGESLDKGEGVCAGNAELESHEFGLTPDGEIVLWHHDYRTGIETVVWNDPSGITGHHLNFTADGTVVLYDDKNAPLCALGEPTPGVQKPKLVVSPQGEVSVRSAVAGGGSLWMLDPATSSCQHHTRSLGIKDINPLDCVLRGKLDVGDYLNEGEGVCAGNAELESHEFGLTPGGEIVLWHHDYRTGIETVVWKDPSGTAGHRLELEADGTAVLYDDNYVPLCALGDSSPGIQNPKLVVSPQGEVSVRSAAAGGGSLWTLDPATSECK